MRLINLTSLMFFFALSLFGQEEQPLHPKFSEIYCTPPQLVAKAVIHYEGYSKAYLEFDTIMDAGGLTIRSLDEAYTQAFTVFGNELLVTNLPAEKLFEVEMTDDCGEPAVVGMLSTMEGDVETFGIEVSNRMFRAIMDFQALEPEQPLSQFLNDLVTVSPYEKIAFIQQYFYGGQKFQTDGGTVLPPAPPPPPPPTEDTCLCRFVFNTTQIAAPAVLMSGVLGHVHEESVGQDGGIKIKWNNGAKYWWFRNTKGAAKWHYAWSEGFGTGGDHKSYSYSVVDSTLASPHMGQLAYNFLCTNYSEVPRECECEKRLHLYYRYDSRAVVHGELLGSSINDRTAEARTQDIGVVTLQMGDEPIQVYDAGDVRAESECDSGANTSWFVNLLEVAKDIVQYYIYTNSGSTFVTAIGQSQTVGNLADDLQQLIGQPVWLKTGCETETVDATLALGNDLEVDLPPNTPAFFNVFSFTNQRVGGKRKWFSYAGIESKFYLTGVVLGGRLPGGPEACCTKKIGNWVFGSLESDLANSTQNLANQVGGILGLYAPWNLPQDPFSNIVIMPSEYGWTEMEAGCDEIHGLIVPPGDGTVEQAGVEAVNGIGELTEENGGLENNVTGHPEINAAEAEGFEPEKIFIFDLNGRMLYGGSETVLPGNFKQFLTERGVSNVSGIYFVHLVGQGQRKTIKVFVPN